MSEAQDDLFHAYRFALAQINTLAGHLHSRDLCPPMGERLGGCGGKPKDRARDKARCKDCWNAWSAWAAIND